MPSFVPENKMQVEQNTEKQLQSYYNPFFNFENKRLIVKSKLLVKKNKNVNWQLYTKPIGPVKSEPLCKLLCSVLNIKRR